MFPKTHCRTRLKRTSLLKSPVYGFFYDLSFPVSLNTRQHQCNPSPRKHRRFSRLTKIHRLCRVLLQSLIQDNLSHLLTALYTSFFRFSSSKMTSNNSFNSIDWDNFYLEQESGEQILPRKNTPEKLNSTELSRAPAREVITISTVTSPEPHIITIQSHWNDPTIPSGYGSHNPITPSSLNDLKLPPISFNILATTVVTPRVRWYDERDSPQSPESSDPSPISTRPMTFNTIEGRNTSSDAGTYHSEDEPRKLYLLSSPFASPPPPPRKQKRKLSKEMSFPKKTRVSQHVKEDNRQTMLEIMDNPGPSTDWN